MSTINKSFLKETYSDSMEPKNKRFKRLKTLLQPKGKATAELDASKNPMEWLKNHKEMNIKKLKGVAF